MLISSKGIYVALALALSLFRLSRACNGETELVVLNEHLYSETRNTALPLRVD